MLVGLIILVIFFTSVKSDGPGKKDWGYGDRDGPHAWKGICAEGFRQSPVNFKASELNIVFLPKLYFPYYNKAGTVNVTNKRESISVSGFDTWGERQPYIFGGGLQKYRLIQFHFHWAQNDLDGSEHTVGGLHYPAEVHFVHFKGNYTQNEALKHPDGIAVVGVFFTLASEGRSLAKIDRHLQSLNKTTNTVQMNDFVLDTLLPLNTDAFYRYEGSLTTPGCHESVIWTVMADPVPITQEQLNTFRQMRGDLHIENNSRPVLPLNRRKVSFRPSNFERSDVCGSAATSNIKIGFLIISSIITFFNFML